MEDFLLAVASAEAEVAAVVFNTELNYIKNDRIRSSAEVLISKIPDSIAANMEVSVVFKYSPFTPSPQRIAIERSGNTNALETETATAIIELPIAEKKL